MNENFQNDSPINYNEQNYNLYRSSPKNKKSKKLNFKTMKKNTICSLNEVEYFLNNFQHAIKYVKLYKLLK